MSEEAGVGAVNPVHHLKEEVLVTQSWPTLYHPMARLLCSWKISGKNTGAGCHFLLQPKVSSPTLIDRLLTTRTTWEALRQELRGSKDRDRSSECSHPGEQAGLLSRMKSSGVAESDTYKDGLDAPSRTASR